jgi:hypothetical protein
MGQGAEAPAQPGQSQAQRPVPQGIGYPGVPQSASHPGFPCALTVREAIDMKKITQQEKIICFTLMFFTN